MGTRPNMKREKRKSWGQARDPSDHMRGMLSGGWEQSPPNILTHIHIHTPTLGLIAC